MKSIYIFVATLLLVNSIKAQTPVLALGEHRPSTVAQDAYLKDIDNVLDTYEGTWLYDQNGIYLKIVLEKQEIFYNNVIYQDLLTGAFQYKENGVEIMNTLSELSNPTITGYQHKIYGNSIFKTCIILPVDDCVEGEARVSIYMKDLVEDQIYYNLVLHKREINGQDAIKFTINRNSRKFTYAEGEPRLEATVDLQGEYVFLKQ